MRELQILNARRSIIIILTIIKFQVVLFGPTMYSQKAKSKQTGLGTIGIELHPYLLKIRGHDCRFLIYDTDGHQHQQIEQYNLNLLKNITMPRLTIICYELFKEDGEQKIEHHINLINSRYDNDVDIVIIGTKLEQGIHKNQENIDKRFQNYKIYKVSKYVEETFLEIFHQLYDKYKRWLPIYFSRQFEQMKKDLLWLI